MTDYCFKCGSPDKIMVRYGMIFCYKCWVRYLRDERAKKEHRIKDTVKPVIHRNHEYWEMLLSPINGSIIRYVYDKPK